MRLPFLGFIAFLCLASEMAFAELRQWTSAAGNVTFEAEVIAFSQDMVVLKRTSGELQAVELAALSEQDQEFVRSKEVADDVKKSADQLQTWTAKDGLKVEARIVDYGRGDLIVQRKLGQVHINDKKFSELDPLHQKVVLRILSHLEESPLANETELVEWAKKIGGEPRSYPLEGVRMQLANGDEVSVPFFLFAQEDLEILQAGWLAWLEREESDLERERESFLMRSAAMAYQREQVQQRQLQMLNLNLLAAATGAISIWEVVVVPGPNVYGRPMSIMVPAANSEQAVQVAFANYPGYQLAGVRRANRR